MRRYIREHRIEAIVSFHFVADFICGLAATDLGVPVISSRRDMGFTRTGRQKQAGRLLRGRFARWIAVSDAVRQAIHRDEAIPLDRIEVVYNGIDIDALDAHGCCREAERARHQIGDDELVVGCVANFNAVKRHVTLIEAVDRLRRSYPQLKLRLVLTGDGPERPNIEQRIHELNLGDTVILAGRSEQPTGALLAADIFVLPSESEGFSNAIVQAMACRRPVVACRVGGNPEAVDEGTTGFLVEPGDAEALARGIEPLLLDIDLRRRMGEAGRERALQHFSIDAMMRRTQQIVEDEIARHR